MILMVMGLRRRDRSTGRRRSRMTRKSRSWLGRMAAGRASLAARNAGSSATFLPARGGLVGFRWGFPPPEGSPRVRPSFAGCRETGGAYAAGVASIAYSSINVQASPSSVNSFRQVA